MIASFNHLFLAGLKPEGVYIVEDVHANYWMSHRDQSYSFMDFAKDLADVMHQHYVGARGEMEFRIGGADRPSQRTVPRLTRELREIRFLDSLILFYRQQRSLPTSEHL
jgi:hypothetical protein